ncbi:MAG: anaerobic sulfatase maturase [Planctomycetes bacterium]|nr:anaerobic sulfatase maturase [Planctomycetota bacterium]
MTQASTSKSLLPLPVLPARPPSARHAARPFHVIAKPIGPICNLRCEYCFYLEKEDLYPRGEPFRMPESVLENFIRQYIESQPVEAEEVNFAWQGGEPTLRGLPFFRRAVEWQRRYARPGLRITNAFQTNGVLLDGEWAQFLHDEHFLVGISIDGPEGLHDRYRVDAKGRGTFGQVMKGLDALRRCQVEFNTLSVVQRDNGDHPVEVYDFLRDIGSQFMQFIPIVEVLGPEQVTDRSVLPEQFGRFMNGVFDRWIERDDIGRIFVQHFDLLLGLLAGFPATLCVHAETCGRAAAIEHNGDLYSCDHFVNAGDLLGNIAGSSLSEMLDGPQQTRFGNDKRDRLPRYCRECEFLKLCYGGCPAHRNIRSPDGEPGLNYLCKGYQLFYARTQPYFRAMAECLRRRRPARDYRSFMEGRGVSASGNPGPNGPEGAWGPGPGTGNLSWNVKFPGPANAGPVGRSASDPRRGRGMAISPSKTLQADASTRPVRRARPNAPCPCGSGKKFKKCCGSSGNEISPG